MMGFFGRVFWRNGSLWRMCQCFSRVLLIISWDSCRWQWSWTVVWWVRLLFWVYLPKTCLLCEWASSHVCIGDEFLRVAFILESFFDDLCLFLEFRVFGAVFPYLPELSVGDIFLPSLVVTAGVVNVAIGIDFFEVRGSDEFLLCVRLQGPENLFSFFECWRWR